MNKKKLLIIAAIAIVGGAIAYSAFIASKDTGPIYETVAARRGAIFEDLVETGTVVAASDLDLFFRSVGRVADIPVNEGEAVVEGQALMRLDTSELRIRLREADAALASAQAKYAQAVAGATAEDLRVLETAIMNAETALASARQSLADAERALDDARASSATAVAKAETDLRGSVESATLRASTTMNVLLNAAFDANGNRRNDYVVTDSAAANTATSAFGLALDARTRLDASVPAFRLTTGTGALVTATVSIGADVKIIRDAAAAANTMLQNATPSGGLSQTAFDARKADVKLAWSDLSVAANALDAQVAATQNVLIQNTAAENVALAKVNAAAQAVLAADGALTTARNQLQSENAPLREVDKAVYLAAVTSARAGRDLVAQQIADATLTAPIDGVVGSIDVKLGELAGPTVRATTLISASLLVEADVSELDIRKLSLGMSISASFDALGPDDYPGTIVEIAARETRVNDDIFYGIKVMMENGAPVRTGMTSDIRIRVGEKQDALLVPKRLIARSGGKAFVRVLVDGEPLEREVRVGLIGRDDAEVLDGLNEGDLIVTGTVN